MKEYTKMFGKRYTIVSLTVVTLISVYTIAGFFVLPKLIKPRLESALSETTGEKVSIKDIDTNPFYLSASIENLEISGEEKDRIASFKELHINFDITSIYKDSYIFSDVELHSPYLHIKLLEDGSINIAKFFGINGEPAENKKNDRISFFVDSLIIDKGILRYEELNRPKPYSVKIIPLNVNVKNLNTKKTGGGTYTIDAKFARGGKIYWNGSISVHPLKSEGEYRLEDINLGPLVDYFRNRTGLTVENGLITFSGKYSIALDQNATDFRISEGTLKLKEAVLARKDSDQKTLKMPDTVLKGISLSTGNKKLEISSVFSGNGSVTALLDSEGNFNLDNFYNPPETTTTGQAEKAPSEWNVRINKVNIEKYAIEFVDRTKEETVNVKATNIGIDINDIAVGEKSRSEFNVSAIFNNQAELDLSGKINFESLTGDFVFDLQNIGALPFYPYIKDFADLKIEEGNIKAEGQIERQETGKERRLVYTGNAVLSKFTARDYTKDNVFNRFSRLELKNIFLDIEEFERISIREILLSEPFFRLIIFPDNRTNIHSIFLKGEKEGDSENTNLDKKDDKHRGIKYSINSIKIKDGVMDFSDLSLQPNFRVDIQNLQGTISEISSDIDSNTEIDIEGSVGKYSPVLIKGEINPAKDDTYADINMDFNNLHLTTFNPYSGQFAGYKIDRGTMDLDLEYRLKENIIRGDNHIVIKQIKLGEKVKTPEQKSLPLELAIALLKDSNGVIDINLPVSGNIENPEFSFGSIIATAFSGMVLKIVKSPFSLLGKLVGLGGEELSYVRFNYGTERLSQKEKEKLDKLALAMSERPEVILEVRGMAVTPDDKEALAQKTVFSRIFGNSLDKNIEDMSMNEYRRVIEFYEEKYGQNPLESIRKTDDQGNEIPQPTRMVMAADEAINKLVSDIEIKEEQLLNLASSRAENIKNYLTSKEEIQTDRVVLLSPEIVKKQNAEVVKIPLNIRTY